MNNPYLTTDVTLFLKLESDGKEVKIPTKEPKESFGNIETIRLNLYTYGFSCFCDSLPLTSVI